MMELKVRSDVLLEYVSHTPLPLAFERCMEASIYRNLRFERPVLDIGCGEGLYAHIIFEGKVDTGIDPNPRELIRARQLGAYHELIQCLGDNIPKLDGSYRTIFSNSVLEHIPDLGPVLREARRLLAAGGRFYFTVPSDKFDSYSMANRVLTWLGLNSLASRYRAFFNRFWRHYHYYTPQQWRRLAEDHGFRVIEAFSYNPARTCVLNDALMPISVPGFVVKRLTNRWNWWPSLRKVVLYPIYLWARRFLRGASRAHDGGLVFVHLERAD